VTILSATALRVSDRAVVLLILPPYGRWEVGGRRRYGSRGATASTLGRLRLGLIIAYVRTIFIGSTHHI